MEISSVRENIKSRLFNSTKYETVVSNKSNPFKQTSFKGNVLSADVFESATKAAKECAPKNKLTMSALVGSISNFGSKIQAGIESIVAFGNRMKEGFSNTWNMLNKDISLAEVRSAISNRWNSMFETTNPKVLAKNKTVDELGTMLNDAIADYSAIAA